MTKKKTKNSLKDKLKQMKLSLLRIVFIMAIIAIGGFVYFQRIKAEQKPVHFVHPLKKDLTKYLEVSGVVDADEKVRLRFLAGGKVVYLGAQEGDSVKKYQTIATIDEALLRKQLQLDLNNYSIQRDTWEQVRDDYVENGQGIPQPIANIKDQRYVHQQQLKLNNSVLNVEIRSIAIKNNRLTAPFSGILTHSPISSVGGQVMATDYFEIVNPQSLIFKATVDEADIAQVKLGQKGKITLDAYPDQSWNSQIKYISYSSYQNSDGSTVFLIKLPLTKKNLNQFRLGMNGDVYLQLAKKKQVLSLPIEALKERNGHDYVMLKTADNQTKEKEIQIGLETDNDVEVTQGLTSHDQVLLPK